MGKDRLGCFRPLTCIRRKKLMNVRTYTKVTGIYKVEEWDEPDSSNFEEIQEENLSKPDDVTTSKPRLASECGMKKASLRACSERGSEFDIQHS